MERINKSEIEKKYIDDILKFYIYELYLMVVNPALSRDTIRRVLDDRIKNDLMGKFIIDYKINVHICDLETKRDQRISVILEDNIEDEYFIEVSYLTTDRNFNSVKINENLLKSYVF